jgi:hypothetical protein
MLNKNIIKTKGKKRLINLNYFDLYILKFRKNFKLFKIYNIIHNIKRIFISGKISKHI